MSDILGPILTPIVEPILDLLLNSSLLALNETNGLLGGLTKTAASPSSTEPGVINHTLTALQKGETISLEAIQFATGKPKLTPGIRELLSEFARTANRRVEFKMI
jgi:hypothetical protein